jgi:hypothetical protein
MPPRRRQARKTRTRAEDLRGAARLAVDATRGVTDLVEAAQLNIAGGPTVLGRPLEGLTRLFTGPVYGSIRGVTQLVGMAIDATLRQVAPLLGRRAPGRELEVVLGVLNGVVGDHLARSGNPLAIEMQLRRGGEALELEPEALRLARPRAGGRLLVLVHGSCGSDWIWDRLGHDHGAALERDLGFTPVYLRYNSGLHVSTNGHALDALLERLVAAWPAPIDELAILAHSMGGLVARSACHSAEVAGHCWRGRLGTLVCLGTPHQGAPLERGGHWVDLLLGASRYSAPFARLGRIRSAGVTDMRFGSVLDEDWEGRDRFGGIADPRGPLALPGGVRCCAIAATLGDGGGGRLPGDGLVPVESALGRHTKAKLALRFTEANRWIAHGMGHLDLLDRAEVYDKIRSWLSR